MVYRSLVADLRHMTGLWEATPGQILVRSIPRILLRPGFRAVLLYRVSQYLWKRRATRTLAYWCQARAIRAAGVDIHPAARIGPGLGLVHSVGIVVGREVVAGRDLVLYQGVTLGDRGHGTVVGQPRLGDRVRIYAGAKVLGPIVVGDDVTIGANAVVLADVPSRTAVVGLWSHRTAEHSSEPDDRASDS